MVAHGDEESSKVVGRKVRELKLPQGAIVGAIVRNNQVLIAHKSTEIQAEDRVILFVNDKKHVSEIEKTVPSEFVFLIATPGIKNRPSGRFSFGYSLLRRNPS